MRSIRIIALVPAMLALLAAAGAAPAGAVTVTAGSATGLLAGQTVDISITSGDLTGLNVLSYQFSMTFNATYLSVVDVFEAGTLPGNAGWGNATFNAGTGTLTVSHAGLTPLNGAGTLLTIRLLVNPAALSGGSSSLTWQSFLFNEGSPTATTVNGSISIVATPQISVSPNSGEVLVGEQLAFSVSGSVTLPVTWGTTDNAIATMSPSGILTGVAPGSVRVFAVDAAAHSDTSNSTIVIRAARVTVGLGSAFLGQSGTVPVTVTDLAGLGIRAGQIAVSFSSTYVTPTGITTTGTLLDGYGTVDFGTTPEGLIVDFAGTSDLSGAGVLCYLNFDASPVTVGTIPLTLTEAMFNETSTIRANGFFTVKSLPAIGVNPDNVALLAGQTRQFTLSGSATPPIAWSTLNPSVATIDANGLLTALAAGVTKVQAIDDVGAMDQNTAVTVFDFRVWPDTVQVSPGDTVTVPILLDRDVDGLGIYSAQYTVSYPPTWATGLGTDAIGLMNAWGAPVVNPLSGQLVVVGAGAIPLGAGTTLHGVRFAVSASAPVGTSIPLSLSQVLCNEGAPSGQLASGLIQVIANVGVPPPAIGGGLWMSQVQPNPVRDRARFAVSLPGSGVERARLAVYSITGRRIRVLLEGPATGGLHQLEWNLTDESGRHLAPGVYFATLECAGRRLTRKFTAMR